jgi:hypothetical protein
LLGCDLATATRAALNRATGAHQSWCLEPESNRYARLKAADFKSAVSTNFTTEAA